MTTVRMSDWTLQSQRSFDLSLAVKSTKLAFLFDKGCVDSRQHELAYVLGDRCHGIRSYKMLESAICRGSREPCFASEPGQCPLASH